MTYCVAVKLDAGLVFLSDSRTNAGVDQISTFRKMMVYERPGDRFMVMLSAGNLSISQQVREILQIQQVENGAKPPITIWNAKSMFDAAWAALDPDMLTPREALDALYRLKALKTPPNQDSP